MVVFMIYVTYYTIQCLYEARNILWNWRVLFCFKKLY